MTRRADLRRGCGRREPAPMPGFVVACTQLLLILFLASLPVQNILAGGCEFAENINGAVLPSSPLIVTPGDSITIEVVPESGSWPSAFEEVRWRFDGFLPAVQTETSTVTIDIPPDLPSIVFCDAVVISPADSDGCREWISLVYFELVRSDATPSPTESPYPSPSGVECTPPPPTPTPDGFWHFVEPAEFLRSSQRYPLEFDIETTNDVPLYVWRESTGEQLELLSLGPRRWRVSGLVPNQSYLVRVGLRWNACFGWVLGLSSFDTVTAAATPTPSPSGPTPSPSATMPMPSPTASPKAELTPTHSGTPTPIDTGPTPTPSASISPGPTGGPSPSPSPTSTAAVTPSSSPVPTPSPTPVTGVGWIIGKAASTPSANEPLRGEP